jgi:hypothetical protein
VGTKHLQKVNLSHSMKYSIRCGKNNVRNIGIEEWKNWWERGLGSIVKKHERNHLKIRHKHLETCIYIHTMSKPLDNAQHILLCVCSMHSISSALL